MTRTRSSIGRALAVAALTLVGCSDLTHYPAGSPPLPGPGTGSVVPSMGADAGGTSPDGRIIGDAGGTLGDAGGTLGDAGGTFGDAGGIFGDAGGIFGDAGTVGGDAGTLVGDAGT